MSEQTYKLFADVRPWVKSTGYLGLFLMWAGLKVGVPPRAFMKVWLR